MNDEGVYFLNEKWLMIWSIPCSDSMKKMIMDDDGDSDGDCDFVREIQRGERSATL